MTLASLPAAERDRVVACLRLIDRPGTDGERAAALAAALRILGTRGLALADIVTAGPQKPAEQPRWQAPTSPPPPSDWRSLVQECLQHQRLLNAWEWEFVRGLPRYRQLTGKQRIKLDQIVAQKITQNRGAF